MSTRHTRRAFTTVLGGLVSATGVASGNRLPFGRAGSLDTTSEQTDTNASWPTYRHDNGNTAWEANVNSPTDSVEVAWEWTHEVTGARIGVPVVSDDTVYVSLQGSSTGEVVALDATDGSVRWQTAIDSISTLSNPTVDGGHIYLVGSNAVLYTLDARNGSIRDETPFGETTRNRYRPAPPRLVDGTLYAAVSPTEGTHSSRDAVLAAIDVDGCGLSWTTTVEGTDDSRANLEAPAVSDGRIFVVGRVGKTGFLRTISASTGERLWEVSKDTVSRSQTSPVVADGRVYSSLDWFLTAHDATDGTELWQYRGQDEVEGPPAVTDDAVYVGTTVVGGLSMDPPYGALLAALDPETGEELWIREAPSGCGSETNPDFLECDNLPTEWSPPSVGNGTVFTSLDRYYSADTEAGIRALSTEDGSLRWYYPRRVRHAPVLADSAVYLVDRDDARRLVKLAARSA